MSNLRTYVASGLLCSVALAACFWATEEFKQPVDAERDGGSRDASDAVDAADEARPSAPEGGAVPDTGGGTEPSPPPTDGGRWCADAGPYELCRDFDGPLVDAGPLQSWSLAQSGDGQGRSLPATGYETTNGFVTTIGVGGSAYLDKAYPLSGQSMMSLRFKLRRTKTCSQLRRLALVAWANASGSVYVELRIDSTGRYYAALCKDSGFNGQYSCEPSNYLTASSAEASNWSDARFSVSTTGVTAAMNGSPAYPWTIAGAFGTSVRLWVGVVDGVSGCEWVFDNITFAF